MRIIECDRCHKRFKKDAIQTGFICLTTQDVKTGDLGDNNDFGGWDLCDDCVQKIRDFVRMVPPNEEKPKATIKKPVPGTALTQEKIDLIKQMARDGKTVKEICDYTGVSDPTVRKYKKEVCDEKTEPVAEGLEED